MLFLPKKRTRFLELEKFSGEPDLRKHSSSQALSVYLHASHQTVGRGNRFGIDDKLFDFRGHAGAGQVEQIVRAEPSFQLT